MEQSNEQLTIFGKMVKFQLKVLNRDEKWLVSKVREQADKGFTVQSLENLCTGKSDIRPRMVHIEKILHTESERQRLVRKAMR